MGSIPTRSRQVFMVAGFFWVFLGAGVGGMLRHAMNLLAERWGTQGMPWATLIVNVVGSLLMGLVVEALALRGQGNPELRLLLATGILGGFTTFSAFSLETLGLIQRGQTALALGYAVGSVVLSVLAVWAGSAIGQRVF